MADVAILDRAIAGGGAVTPANLKEVRIGVEKTMLANLDAMVKEQGVTLESVLAKKNATGGTSPERVRQQAESLLADLGSTDGHTSDEHASLAAVGMSEGGEE